MTQDKSHRAPLQPGEMRSHTVGNRRFLVMHVAGGSFTQASTWTPGGTSQVLATERFEADAVRAYADAIEQAETALAEQAGRLQSIRAAYETDGVTPLEAIAVLRKWAEFQPDQTGIIVSAINSLERKIKDSP